MSAALEISGGALFLVCLLHGWHRRALAVAVLLIAILCGLPILMGMSL